MKCNQCGREIYGFWKYKFILERVCSMKCLRKSVYQEGHLIFKDKTPDIYKEYFSDRPKD